MLTQLARSCVLLAVLGLVVAPSAWGARQRTLAPSQVVTTWCPKGWKHRPAVFVKSDGSTLPRTFKRRTAPGGWVYRGYGFTASHGQQPWPMASTGDKGRRQDARNWDDAETLTYRWRCRRVDG